GAVVVADPGALGRIRERVVRRLADRAGRAAAQPLDENLLRYLQREDEIDLPPAAGEQLVQGGRLRDRAGESVEQEALLGDERGLHGLLDDPVDEIVGHQLAGVHQSLGLLAEGRAIGDGLAQDVARRELWQAKAYRQAMSLGTLSRSRRTQEDEVQHPACFLRGSGRRQVAAAADARTARSGEPLVVPRDEVALDLLNGVQGEDRKSTRLNSSHRTTSYAVFC